jgi:hypothetical protein
MATFDQRGQKVNYQYNAAGDINFGTVQSKLEIVSELQKLQREIQRATEAGAVDADVAIDVESKIKKAILQTQKPESDKKTTLDYLNEAKALLEGVTSAAGLVTALTQAAEVVKRLF